MTRVTFTLAFLLLGLSFLYGYRVITKGQQKNETVTVIDGKSAKGKDVKNRAHFSEYETGQKLTDPAFIGQQSDEIVVAKSPSKIEIPFERPCPAYPNSGLVGLTYAADAVVIGTIMEKITSQLTEDEEFLFSEYDVVVDDVIKYNSKASIAPTSIISVIRPGGKVKLNDKVISAVVRRFNPFFEGEQYLLYLKYIPDTQSYQAFTNASFPIKDKVIITPSMSPREHNKEAFVTEAKDALMGEHCLRVVLH